MASCSDRCRIISRLGVARPVSTKLKWRAEISASLARSSWLMRRRCRQWRRCTPTGWTFMHSYVGPSRRHFHYLRGKRLFALELRGALFDEGEHAFAGILGAHQRQELQIDMVHVLIERLAEAH